MLYELPFQGIEFQTCIVYIPPAFFCFFEGEPGVQTCSETYFQNVSGGGGDGSGCGCLIAIAVVVVLVLIAMGS